MQSVKDKLYSISDLASRYSVMSKAGSLSRQTIYRWRRDRGFPDPKLTSPQNFWLKTEVHQWEKENDLGWMQ